MAHTSLTAGGDTPVTVATLLGEPMLRGSLVAGRAGVDRAVTWCLPLSEVGQEPAPAATVSDLDGVVVHAPTAALSGERARRLVASLHRRGAAALLAWPPDERGGTDLGAASSTAESAALPLLALHPAACYRQVNHLVAMKVLTQTAHVLEYSVRVHRILGEVFAHGSGLVAMARTMSHLAHTPVFVLAVEGETVAHADSGLPASTIPADVGHAVVTQLTAVHSRERETSAATGDAAPEHSRLVTLTVGGDELHAVAAPVSIAGEPYGAVLLLEPGWPADEHDLAQHRVIAEQGATLVGSELLRQRSVQAAEERARDDFVDALLHARFTDQHELANRARHYRFDLDARFAVFVITSGGARRERHPDNLHMVTATRAAGAVAADADLLTLTTRIDSTTDPMIIVLRQIPPVPRTSRDRADTEHRACRRFAEQLHRAMLERLGECARVAYGRAGTGAAGVASSYREARTALAIGERVRPTAVCGYDDLRVFAALEEAAASAAGQQFAADVLEPLRRGNGPSGSLEQIVLAYFHESGNIVAAARALKLHRNTILYKLDHASRALQMDVRRSETQFMVWLAHHIDMLNQVGHRLRTEQQAPPR